MSICPPITTDFPNVFHFPASLWLTKLQIFLANTHTNIFYILNTDQNFQLLSENDEAFFHRKKLSLSSIPWINWNQKLKLKTKILFVGVFEIPITFLYSLKRGEEKTNFLEREKKSKCQQQQKIFLILYPLLKIP